MKTKLTKQPEPEIEQDEEEVDVESSGPAIAAAKKSKMAVIAASSILITVVIYVMFFKGEKKDEKLEEVVAPKGARVAPSDEGKSPFELEAPEKAKDEDANILAKPATPEVPTLPELPAGMVAQEPLAPADAAKAGPAGTAGPQAGAQQVLPDLRGDQTAQQQQADQQGQRAVASAGSDRAGDSLSGRGQDAEPAPAKSKELDPRYAPIIVFAGTATGTPGRGVGYEDNIVQLDKDAINQLQKSPTGTAATYIADRAHTIAQGKLLTAVLETAIDTQLPGSVRGIISRDVYAEAGDEVLIPRGSRLYGAYSTQVVRGQGRVQIGWTRLIRPDGVDLKIAFNASDQFGRSGIYGDIDNKYSAVVAGALLTSVLAVGAVAAAQQFLGNDADTTTTTNASTGSSTTTGSATNQAMYDVSKNIMDTVGTVVGNAVNSTPVIRVPQGTRITVVVNSDINVPALRKKR